MRIWLITVGEPLPTDGGQVRLMRTGVLAENLASEGHDVVWWTSTFNHTVKRHRFGNGTTLRTTSGAKLMLLHSVGYRSNLSLRRIVNHRGVARRFFSYAKDEPPPDVIVCSFPTIELSKAAVGYGRARGIPVILDVRDLWPDIFLDLVPKGLRKLTAILLSGLVRDTRRSFRQASCITAVSREYLEWGLRYAGREKRNVDRVFPLACQEPSATEEELGAARAKLLSCGVDPSKPICWFVGFFGRTYDLDTVIDVASEFEARGKAMIQFVLCGDGEFREKWVSRSAGLSNVIFPGWIDVPEFAYLSEVASVGLAAYAAGAPQGLPNKVLEYLSAGLPVLSSLKGETASLLSQHACGITYEAGDAQSLMTGLSKLVEDGEARRLIGQNARRLFEERFAAARVYADMQEHILEVAQSGAQ
jgi:glycosyltransferase involved in cell wall biosynthesis